MWRPKASRRESFARIEMPTNLTARKIQDSFAAPETMSFWELPSFIRLLENSGFSALRHRLYFDALLARPLLFAAMVLIAASFSLRMQRRGGDERDDRGRRRRRVLALFPVRRGVRARPVGDDPGVARRLDARRRKLPVWA